MLLCVVAMAISDCAQPRPVVAAAGKQLSETAAVALVSSDKNSKNRRTGKLSLSLYDSIRSLV